MGSTCPSSMCLPSRMGWPSACPFRDVTGHVRRVQEGIDSLREVLAFAFEASLMMGQAQQSAIARKLAAWAAILAVPRRSPASTG